MDIYYKMSKIKILLEHSESTLRMRASVINNYYITNTKRGDQKQFPADY